MTRNNMKSLAKGNGIPCGKIYEAALQRKWLKPISCVTAGWAEQSAEAGNSRGLLTDDLQDYSA